jgi:methylglutaconyl-CoA hydratase
MKSVVYFENGSIAYVKLNRPEVRNAFNEITLSELCHTFEQIKNNKQVRIVILSAEGKVFCAGADFNWMKRMKDFTFDENIKDANLLAKTLYTIYSSPKLTIAKVNGPVLAGGVGFVCVCDLAYASDEAYFCLTEVRLGLIPACISPYIIKRIGEANTRRLFLTAERITAKEAEKIGLVNVVVKPEELDSIVEQKAKDILLCAPEAIASCKYLIEKVSSLNLEKAKEFTSQMLAKIRIGNEAQEGMQAFFEKRKPEWQK